jgi:hypothetical protein
MSKSPIDQLREHLEDVENYWLTFAIIMFFLCVLAGLTLTGVYFYARR